jgi:Multidrug resistance efflux pump
MDAGTKGIRKGPKVVGTVILSVVALVAAVGGTLWGIDAVGYVSTDDASIDGKQVKLSSRVLGRIRGIAVSEGDAVSAGDVLVTLDATDLRAQEAQAEAALAYAKQNLVLAGISQGKAVEDFARIEGLFRNAATTRENYEHARSALDAANAQYALAQASVGTSEAQLGVIRAQLLNMSIASPISGTVDKIPLVPGDVVQPGQTILSVSDLADIWVIANLEETKIARIANGARVRITVDAYGKRRFDGTVEMIRAGIVAPAFQIGEFTKTTQRVPVKIRLEGSREGLVLLPGMSCEVKVRTGVPLPSFIDR